MLQSFDYYLPTICGAFFNKNELIKIFLKKLSMQI